jgi:hypothetical protein
MDDPESVDSILRSESDDEKKKGIPLAGWKTEHDLLSAIVDVLNNLHATLIQVNDEKGRRPEVHPMPRPTTALGRVEAKQAIEDHRALVAKFRPVN